MAERIVDLLEPVEVDEQQRHPRVGIGTRHERLLDALGEQEAVGQPGERVVMRVVDRALAFDHQQAPVAPRDRGEQPGEEQPRQEHRRGQYAGHRPEVLQVLQRHQRPLVPLGGRIENRRLHHLECRLGLIGVDL
jgi:hypothetical protein